jgi:DNA-binding SARP family transcriptional activator/tetratricopeptide (TPR) repeat protein
LDGLIQINLLGGFHFQVGTGPPLGPGSNRLQTLIAYLVLNQHRPIPRRQLAFLFWPDSSEQQAFANLRNLFSQLRRVLPHPDRCLEVSSSTIQWSAQADCVVDVDVFEQALAVGDLEQAVRIYTGDLLPDCYDNWISPERERLKDAYSWAIEQLIHIRRIQNDYAGAIGYAKIYSQYDPLNENHCILLMRLHASLGERKELELAYQECRQALKGELDLEPGPLLEAAHDQLLLTPEMPNTRRSGLIGRSGEWQHLLNRWQECVQGQAGLTLVAGEAGIGKTCLLEEFIQSVCEQGCTAALARCYSTSGRLAYAPVIEWLRQPEINAGLEQLEPVWLAEISRLLPELSARFPELPMPRQIKEGWQRTRLFEALSRAIYAGPQPLLLVLDDLQWADPDTLAFLVYLVQYKPQGALLAAASIRPEEKHSPLILSALNRDLKQAGLLSEFELKPLEMDACRELVHRLCTQGCSAAEMEQIYRETEGIPLFIVEMVASHSAAGSPLPFGRPSAHYDPRQLKGKVEGVIAARLDLLGGAAQSLAALAAASGRAFRLPLLLRAWKSSEDAMISGLDELLQRRIVREQGPDLYDFSHDKIREAVYGRLNQAHRRLLHRRLAEAHELGFAHEIEAASGEIASHYQKAGIPEKALPHYLRAGESASRLYANEEAASYLEQGLEILLAQPDAVDAETAFRLMDALGDVLTNSGANERARQVYETIFQLCQELNPLRRAQTRRKIGVTFSAPYRSERIIDELDRAEQELAPLRSSGSAAESSGSWQREYLNICIERMWVVYFTNQPELMESIEENYTDLLKRWGTPDQQVQAYRCQAGIQMRQERFRPSAKAMRLYMMSFEASKMCGDENVITYTIFSLGFGLLWARQLAAAEEYLLLSKEMTGKTGNDFYLNIALTYLAVVYRQTGRLEQAEQAAREALSLAEKSSRPIYVGMGLANLAWACWRKGNGVGARELGEQALQVWASQPIPYPFQWAARLPLAADALERRDLLMAVDHTRALLDHVQLALPHELEQLLEECTTEWDRQHPQQAACLLEQAVEIAQKLGYL